MSKIGQYIATTFCSKFAQSSVGVEVKRVCVPDSQVRALPA